MPTPKDSAIEQCLRRIAKEAGAKGEQVTLRTVRARAEAELKLQDGFFKNDERWKKRSNDVVTAAFEEEESEAKPSHQPRKQKAAVASSPSSKAESSKLTPQQSSQRTSASSGPAAVSSNKTKALPKKEDVVDSGSSSGSEDESEDEGEDDQEGQTKTQSTLQRPDGTPSQVNGVKRKASETSSAAEGSEGDADASTEGEEELEEPQKKKPRTESRSEAEEDSEDEAGEEEDEEGPDHEREPAAKPPLPDTQAEVPDQPSMPAIPPKAFQPPPGYTALDATTSMASSAFSDSAVEGKQIWHIAAPSDVPLSSITEVALDAIKSGQPILTHKGVGYVLNEDSTHSKEVPTVLVPTREGYKRIDHPVTRSLQLRQKITLPNLSARQADLTTGSRAAADIGQAAVTTIRPQPKGLRMRFRPPGFGSGELGRIGSGSDVTDEEDDPPSTGSAFQFPKALGGHETAVPQSEDAREADTTIETPVKKPKKKRKEKEITTSASPKTNGVAGTPASQPKQSSTSFSPETSKGVAALTSAMSPTPVPNGVSPEAPSKEEQKKQKQERRQAKPKAKKTMGK